MEKGFWRFIDNEGSFVAENPHKISRLYFPLCNEAGLMSSITPNLNGDIKTGLNNFLTLPISVEDIHNTRSNRQFWVYIKGKPAWPCAGPYTEKDKVQIQAGPLWHKLTKENRQAGLKAEITNFVPAKNARAEIMFVEITNITNKTMKITPTAAIPMYARSADNIRDHHHVTSLLHRIFIKKHGIVVNPVMSFDERGHNLNTSSYYVFGCEKNGASPKGFFPTIQHFIGEGGNLENPEAIIKNLPSHTKFDYSIQGKEALGGVRFADKTLKPGQAASFILLLGIADDENEINKAFALFNSTQKIQNALKETKKFWKNITDGVCFDTKNNNFDNWMRWITLQPTLRKIFGCGFLPDFDYGRGGRGWRDLWQDCLALILTHPESTRKMLLHNFNGVRIDGTNATIITKNGDFIADRNKITRVWMDHGVWPFFTLEYYMHQTGDFGILMEEGTYFRDPQLCRAHAIDYNWNEKTGKQLKTTNGKIYKGSILERILVQHLVQFFNVGKHNNIKLETADWNDGLDMANERGESVAFTCYYGANLQKIADALRELKSRKKIDEISIARELLVFLDPPAKKPSYDSASQKQKILNKYLASVKYKISGRKVNINIDDLVKDLERKAAWIQDHVRKTEWININKKSGFYNGYYDNNSKRAEGIFKNNVRMMLPSQAMAVMNDIATDEQVGKIAQAVNKYLKDKEFGGIHLNTNYQTPQMDLGRAFAFSYGEKENGAIFCHMNTIYANGLYRRGFAKEGNDVLYALYKMAVNSNTSKIYPGIPEYFNLEGRGLYNYLTGTASWLVKTMVSFVFGLRGECGNLLISPKLTKNYFEGSKTIKAHANFAGKRIELIYNNPKRLDWGKYRIEKILVNGKVPTTQIRSKTEVLIERSHLLGLAKNSAVKIEVLLA